MTSSTQPIELSPVTPAVPEEDGIDLGQILGSLRRGWKPILLAVLIAGGGISLSWLVRKPTYEGEFQIVLGDPNQGKGNIGTTVPTGGEGKGGGLSGLGGLADLAGLAGAGGGGNDLETQLEVLQSPSILQPYFQRVRQQLENPDLTFEDFSKKILKVELGKKTRVVTVTLQSKDRDFLARTLQDLSKTYQEYSDRARKRSVSKGLQYLDQQIPRKKQQLDALAAQLESLQQRYQFLDPEKKAESLQTIGESSVQAQLQVRTQLQAVQIAYQRLQQQSSLSAAEALVTALQAGGGDGAASAGAGNAADGAVGIPAASSLLGELRRLDTRLAVESSRLKPTEPSIVSLKARRDKVLQALQRQAQAQLIRLQAQDQALATTNQQLTTQVQQLPTIARSYIELRRQYEITSKTLENLLLQQSLLQLDQAKKPDPWELITKPTVSEKPVAPKRGQELATALLVGVLAGAGYSLWRDRQQGRIHEAAALRSLYSGPILGPLAPDAEAEAGRLLALQLLDRLPTSPVAMVSARTPVGAEGARSLAQAWGDLGQRTLLLDLISPASEKGFWDAVTYPALEFGALLRPLGHQSWLLTGGTVEPDPTTLASQAGTTARLANLSDQFDRVLVLLPPLLTQAWAGLLARQLPSVLWTLPLGEATLADEQQLLALLPAPPQVLLLD